jgi:hypothetical protein
MQAEPRIFWRELLFINIRQKLYLKNNMKIEFKFNTKKLHYNNKEINRVVSILEAFYFQFI